MITIKQIMEEAFVIKEQVMSGLLSQDEGSVLLGILRSVRTELYIKLWDDTGFIEPSFKMRREDQILSDEFLTRDFSF